MGWSEAPVLQSSEMMNELLPPTLATHPLTSTPLPLNSDC